jgi:hypothetical protein
LRRTALAFALSAATLFIRHNTIALAPFLAALLYWAARSIDRRYAFTLALAMLAVKPVGDALMYASVPIKRQHPECQVLALDILGVCVEHEHVIADLPYTRACLRPENLKKENIYGCAGNLFNWGPNPVVTKGYVWTCPDELHKEYRTILFSHPGTLATVKVKAFSGHLLYACPFWHNTTIDSNQYGLKTNQCRWSRVALEAIDKSLYDDTCIRFVVARHLGWLGMNVLLLGGAAALYVVGRKRRALVLGAVLLIPLAYYGSYALASVAFDYRYMYPATLVIQIVTLTLLAAGMRLGVQRFSRIIPD